MRPLLLIPNLAESEQHYRLNPFISCACRPLIFLIDLEQFYFSSPGSHIYNRMWRSLLCFMRPVQIMCSFAHPDTFSAVFTAKPQLKPQFHSTSGTYLTIKHITVRNVDFTVPYFNHFFQMNRCLGVVHKCVVSFR